MLDILSRLRDLDCRIEMNGHGPVLKGSTLAVPAELVRELGRRRDEVIAYLSSAREWLWRDGHHFRETPEDEWYFGRKDRHPVGAFWWRLAVDNGGRWQDVPGRHYLPVAQPREWKTRRPAPVLLLAHRCQGGF